MTNDWGQVNDKPAKGKLGYTVGGEYSVSVPGNEALVYVRFDDGSFAQVYHRGRVAPIPDLPVEVGLDGTGNLVILGGDPARPGAVAGAAGAYEVGLHSHARGSGMEFPVDARLLTPVRASPEGDSPDGGLVVRVEQGAYWYGGALRWWGGGSITLTPPATTNQWAWMVIGIDAAAGTSGVDQRNGGRGGRAAGTLDHPGDWVGGDDPAGGGAGRAGADRTRRSGFRRFALPGRRARSELRPDPRRKDGRYGRRDVHEWGVANANLNVKATDASGFVTLSANQITLAAGTYRLRASAPAYEVGGHQARWQNVSDGVTVAVGTAETTAGAQTRSIVAARFSISASKTFELQHQGFATRSTDGFGVAAGFDTEVYSEIELWRE